MILEPNENGYMDETLLPPYYCSNDAAYTVTINDAGQFVAAEKVADKRARRTPMPCTPDASSRTGTSTFAMPLCEKVSIICAPQTQDIDPNPVALATHQNYMALLTAWCASEFAHPAVQAVLRFLREDDLFSRMLGSGAFVGNVASAEENLAAYKADPKKLGAVFLRWRVLQTSGQYQRPELWMRKDVADSWGQFMRKKLMSQPDTRIGYCSITGEKTVLGRKFPGRLVSPGNGAKFFSTNSPAEQMTRYGQNLDGMMTVGEETGQKIAAMLKCLSTRNAQRWSARGEEVAAHTYIFWNVGDKLDVPDPTLSTEEIEGLSIEEIMELNDRYCEAQEPERILKTEYANMLKRYIAGVGINVHIENDNDIAYLNVETPTKGRLVVGDFDRLPKSEFFARIQAWHTGMAAMQYIQVESGEGNERRKTWLPFYGAPSLYKIALFVTAEPGCLSKKAEATKTTYNTLRRLLQCELKGLPFPADIALTAYNRAIAAPRYFEAERDRKAFTWNDDRTKRIPVRNASYLQKAGIVCSCIRKYINDQEGKEVVPMVLDTADTRRDYLCGRALAYLQHLQTMSHAADARRTGNKSIYDRETEVEKVLQTFPSRPMQMMADIYTKSIARMAKNVVGGNILVEQFSAIIAQIDTLYPGQEGKPLGRTGEWFVGYNQQLAALAAQRARKKKTSQTAPAA